MKISNALAVAVVSACLGTVGVGALAESAHGASKPQEQDETYQMFANVDAEGDLGSNHDAVKVSLDEAEHVYTITFAHQILHCAAVAQPGRAGGDDPVKAASSVVAQDGKSAIVTRFSDPDGNLIDEPFMVTVTCNKA